MTYAIVRKDLRGNKTISSLPVAWADGYLRNAIFTSTDPVANTVDLKIVTFRFRDVPTQDFDFYETIEQARIALNE